VTVEVPVEVFAQQDRAEIKRLFDVMHEQRYGTSAPEERAEIVSLRSTITGVMKKPELPRMERGGSTPDAAAFTGRRQVYFGEAGGFVETATYARERLFAGNRIAGPALIEEHASTTVLRPGDTMAVDDLANLVIAVSGGR
jgi:N-methylhydantoinase A